MAKNEYLFEKYLNYRLADLISKYSEGKPALVFCQTQKGTINAAQQLFTDFTKLNINENENKIQLLQVANTVKDKQLSNLIKFGIAFHNASLALDDRQIVEESFKKGISITLF